MFSISTEEAHDVEVSITNTPDNRQRIDRLCSLRVNGKYRIEEGHLIYTDRISGLDDFNNYLKSYGSECTIIKCYALKKEMDATLKNTLKKYGISEDSP